MAAKRKDQDRLDFEAAIRANAVGYRVHLFLGRGQYDRAEAKTLAEVIDIGQRMKEAHPTAQASPMFYAIEPSGHATVITPDQFNEEKNMTNIAVNPALTHTHAAEAAQLAKRAKNAERMRAARAAAKAKQTSSTDEAMPTPAITKLAKAMSAVDAARAKLTALPLLAAKAPTPSDEKGKADTVVDLRPSNAVGPALAEANAVAAAQIVIEAPATSNGVCSTRNEALAAARLRYSAGEFVIKKTARGDWFWGPVEAPAPKAEKPAKTAKPAVAAPAALSGKRAQARAEAIEAAQRGVIPAAPDFSPPSHKPFRKTLEKITAMIKARDVAGLKAEKTEPKSSSRVMICRYRDLAIIALEAARD